jgi:hypothetical protein
MQSDACVGWTARLIVSSNPAGSRHALAPESSAKNAAEASSSQPIALRGS